MHPFEKDKPCLSIYLHTKLRSETMLKRSEGRKSPWLIGWVTRLLPKLRVGRILEKIGEEIRYRKVVREILREKKLSQKNAQ